jgi:hypothetical protein
MAGWSIGWNRSAMSNTESKSGTAARHCPGIYKIRFHMEEANAGDRILAD